MPIKSNPDQRRMVIPVGDAQVILVLREPSPEEWQKYWDNRFQVGRRGMVKERNITERRVRFIDQLLQGIEARTAEGVEDYVTWHNPATGEDEELNTRVPDWKDKINYTWKLAVAIELENVLAETETAVLKNS